MHDFFFYSSYFILLFFTAEREESKRAAAVGKVFRDGQHQAVASLCIDGHGGMDSKRRRGEQRTGRRLMS